MHRLVLICVLVWGWCVVALSSQLAWAQLVEPAPQPVTADTLRDAEGIDEPEVCLRDALAPGCKTVRVDAILIEGMFRTRRFVVTRELLFKEGGHASRRQIEESMTRLRNLGLFREVSYRLTTQPVPGVPNVARPTRYPGRLLQITVDERWTLLPAFRFAQGGGLTALSVGFYDINVAGRYLELGAQYDRIGERDRFFEGGQAANSYALWMRDPRFFDTFWRVGVDLWSTQRQRLTYGEDGELDGGFSVARQLLVLRADYELAWWLRAGANVELMSDTLSYDFIREEARAAQQAAGGLPDAGRAFILRAVVRAGRIDQDDYNVDGVQLTQTLAHSDTLWGATYRFTQLETQLNAYKKLPGRLNLAGRVGLGISDVRQAQFQFFLGGLDRVRGFQDSRFRGRAYWSANGELRWAAFASRWIVVQPVGFIDAAATADGVSGLAAVEAASAGVGLRLISPKIYRLVMRFDYAFPFVNNGPAAFNFGAQQFF